MQFRIFKNNLLKFLGLFCVLVLGLFLAILLFSIFQKGFSSFSVHKIAINFPPQIDKTKDAEKILQEGFFYTYPALLNENFSYDDVLSSNAKNNLKIFLKKHEYEQNLPTFWFKTSSNVDLYLKGKKPLKKQDLKKTIDELKQNKAIKVFFNADFFTLNDSQKPEDAGIKAGIISSVFVITIALVFSFFFGLGVAVYFEEFAKDFEKNKFIRLFNASSQLLITNLVAIPSIIYGLLGLWLFIGVFNLPRSSSILGGLTLGLMMLPIIVVSARSSLKVVPKAIKEAAIAIGSKKMQVLFYLIIPYAMPGIITGTLLSLARIIGETAPLLVIGMVAFVADSPSNVFSPASPLPVQIYLWSDKPEAGFAEKASGAIIVLLLILGVFNYLAYFLRKKFETK